MESLDDLATLAYLLGEVGVGAEKVLDALNVVVAHW